MVVLLEKMTRYLRRPRGAGNVKRSRCGNQRGWLNVRTYSTDGRDRSTFARRPCRPGRVGPGEA